MTATIKTRLTKTAVDRLQPGQTIRDTEIRGFGARCQKDGVSYFLQKKVAGRVRWLTIGRHGAPWTPFTARQEALRLLQALAAGEDPTARRRAEREEPMVNDVIDLFLSLHAPKLKPATQDAYQRTFNNLVRPVLGKKRVAKLTRADVAKFHVKLNDRPAAANYALATLSKLMSWCEENGYRQEGTNPCRGVKKYRENKRERYLTLSELAALGEALNQAITQNTEMPSVVAALKLLILTGARLSEILTLKWDYVDVERMALNLPDSKTGKKVIKLNHAAAAVLQEIERVQDNPYVIVGRRQGQHLINLQKPWRRLRKAAGLEDVRIHDLRHSFASMAVSSGASLPMIGKLLGHTQTQTTARYAHLADDPLRQLNEEIGGAIAQAMGGGSSEKTDDCTESENHGKMQS